jgi:hypothetical protein
VTVVTATLPEAAYYQSIEEFFVSRRGDPLFLSNADWHQIRKWRETGIPLRVVLRGIRDALDGHAHSWSRDRKVGSLAYCKQEIEAAYERWARALAQGGEAAPDTTSVLLGCVRALETARGLGPRGLAAVRTIAEALRQKAGDVDVKEIEGWLSIHEAMLLAALGADAGPERTAATEAEVDAALGPYRDRMPARVLDQIRRDSLARRTLEAHGLPRLSLVHLMSGGEGAPLGSRE